MGQLMLHDNLEIILYNCDESKLSLTRTFRYYPIHDPTVNYYVIREADGVVII